MCGDLDEVEGLREGVVGVVVGEDRQRLAAGLDLLLPGLLPLLPLRVRLLAGLLEVHEELLVRGERVPRVLEVELRLRELRVRVRELLRLRVLLLLARLGILFPPFFLSKRKNGKSLQKHQTCLGITI